jgi:hypothetical protein
MERRRWREVSLVVLGVVLHSLYMLSIFDIYFKSPIVTGMQLEPPNIQAPANRLVLFIGTLLLRFLLSLMSWSSYLGENVSQTHPFGERMES